MNTITTAGNEEILGDYFIKILSEDSCTRMYPFGSEQSRLKGLEPLLRNEIKHDDGTEKQYFFCREILDEYKERICSWTEGTLIATIDEDGNYISDLYPNLLDKNAA